MHWNARRDLKDCLKDLSLLVSPILRSNGKRVIQIIQILSRYRYTHGDTRIFTFLLFSRNCRVGFPWIKDLSSPRALRTINDRFALLLPVYPALLPIKINRDCYLLNNPNATRVFAELPAISATIFETPPNSIQPFSKSSRLKTRKKGRKENLHR